MQFTNIRNKLECFPLQAFRAKFNVYGQGQEWSTWKSIHSDRLQPFPKALDYAGKACQGKYSSLLQIFVNYHRKSLMTLDPDVIHLGRIQPYLQTLNFPGRAWQEQTL
jgi:hypothetical protein